MKFNRALLKIFVSCFILNVGHRASGIVPPNPSNVTVEFQSATVSFSEPDMIASDLEIELVLTLPDEIMMLNTEVSVAVSTADGSATSPDDYTANNFSVPFPMGSSNGTTASINVTIQPDMILEGDHIFTVQINSSDEYTIGNIGSVEVTITDEDDVQAFHFNLLPVENPVEGTNTTALVCAVASFNLTELSIPVSVQFTSMDNQAILGEDYTEPDTLSFVFGTTTMSGDRVCLEYGIIDDNRYEADHSFTIEVLPLMTSPTGITIGNGTQNVVIEDNDVTVQMMSVNMTTSEDSGDTLMICAILQAVFYETAATVEMSVSGDSLTTPMEDIRAPGGRNATFEVGSAAPACINITVVDDDDFEGDHQFFVTLVDPYPSTQRLVIDPDDDSITVTITDTDDATITLSDATLSASEGDTVTLCATLNLAGDLLVPIEVQFGLDDNTTTPADYNVESGLNAMFIIGSSNGAQACVDILLLTDSILEGDQVVYATIESTNPATYINDTMTSITIADLAATIRMMTTDFSTQESDADTVMICAEAVNVTRFEVEAIVEMVVMGDSVTTPMMDIMAPGGRNATFQIGDAEPACINITVASDSFFEGDHSFIVTLANPIPSALMIDSANDNVTVTIIDTATIRMTTMDFSTQERDENNVVICAEAVNVTRFEVEAIVEMVVMGDSLTTPMMDIMAPEGRNATFQIGDAGPACINIVIASDSFFEGDHSFTVTLANPIPSTLMIDSANDNVTVTIIDTATIRMMTMDLSTAENDADTVMICAEAVNVTRFDVEAIVEMVVMGDSLTTPMMDIMAPGGRNATFQIGDAEPACINITIEDDDRFEGFHSFTVTLANPIPSTLMIDSANDNVVVTISDFNDATIQFAEADSQIEVDEGDEIRFELLLTTPAAGQLDTEIPVTLTLVDGELAIYSEDFDQQTLNVDFEVGDVDNTLRNTSGSVSIIADMFLEGDHSFTVMLSAPGATIGNRSVLTVVIRDTVDVQAFHFNLLPVENPVEGTDTTALVCAVASFNLMGLSVPVSVPFTSMDNQAILGADYIEPDTLSFVFNTTTMSGDRVCLEYGIIDDNRYEADHSFSIEVLPLMTSPTGITIGTGTQNVIIEDNDVTVQMMSMDMTTSEDSGDTLMICAILQAMFYETAATVEMSVSGDSLTTPMVDIRAPGGRNATFEVGSAAPACINITVVDDDDFEGDHQFFVTLVDPYPSTQRLVIDPDDDSITVTITDTDDATVTLSDATLSASEGDTVTLCATLNLAGNLLVPIEVNFGLDDNTTTPADYNAESGLTAMFSNGSSNGTVACVDILLLTDSILEGDQVVYATIESTNPATYINDTMTSITITDENLADAVVGFAEAQYMGSENSSVMPCVVLSTLPTGGSEVEIEVSVSVLNGSAEQGMDFMAVGSTNVVFPPGSFTLLAGDDRCVEIELFEDNVVEGNEALSLHIDVSSVGISISTIYSVITIQDINTALVGFMQSTYSAVEGQPDDVQVCLEISNLPSGGLATDVMITLSTVDGEKTVSGSDFVVQQSQVVFPSVTTMNGNTSCGSIRILNDDELEGDEQRFNVEVMSISPDNVVVDASANEAIVTIADDDADDAAVGFVVSQVSVMEGQPSTTVTQICLTITNIPSDGLSCPVTATLGTRASAGLKQAIEDQDFRLVEPFEVVFEAGSNNGATECAAVGMIDDDSLEGPHGFEVYVESTNPPIDVRSGDSTSVVTITDNDAGEVRVTGTLQYSLYEGGETNVSLCVEITSLPSQGLECAITTRFEAQPLTAVLTEDYGPFSLLVEILSSTPLNTPVCVENIVIPIVDDMILEDVQSFNLELTSATINGYNIDIGSPNSIEIQIVDNENATVGLTRSDYYGMENQVAVACVFLSDVPSGGSQQYVEVTLSLADSDAVLNEDYVLPDSLTVTFQPGNFTSLNYTEECIEIPLLSDTLIEGDERFYIDQLSTVPSLELGRTSAYVTIRDINVAAVRLVPIVVASEPTYFTTDITVTARLVLETEDELAINLTVPLMTINGTAVSPADFSEVTSPFQVLFPVGSVDGAIQGVVINIHPDSALEGDHHFNVSLVESPEYIFDEPSNIAITIEDEVTTTAFLQLRLQPVDNCTRWIADNPVQKMMDIRRTIAEVGSGECSCNFTEANVINGQFNCRNLVTEVVYTAEIVFSAISTFGDYGASNFVTVVSSWANRGSALQVAGSTLVTDPTCPTRSDSLTSEDCVPPPPVSDALTAGEIAGIVIGVLAFLVIVVLVVIIILVIIIKVGKGSSDTYYFSRPDKIKGPSDDVVLPNVSLYVAEESGELHVEEKL